MFKLPKRIVRYSLALAGYDIRRLSYSDPESIQLQLQGEPDWVQNIIRQVAPYTMTSPHKIAALCHGIEYVIRCKIPGDIVECGVWKGGSMMAVALSLLTWGEKERTLHLFDTFEGMPPPTELDWTPQFGGASAAELMARSDRSEHIWAYASFDEVQRNVLSTGYPSNRIKFVKGKVEVTLPEQAPIGIAVLRLDTDWYESTRHELIHLFPRLATRGVLILDDYGAWDGARKATDDYITENELPILLNRVEPSGRIAIKS